MGDILRELMRVPAKIRPCRRAVLSTMWDPEQRELEQKQFAETVTYIGRLPKEWLKEHLGALTGVEYGTLVRLEKNVKGTVHRLLCRQCGFELNSTVPSRDQQ